MSIDNVGISLIPPLAIVSASLIAGVIAFANLITSKETKVSEFRQAWINSLRDDLAMILSCTRAVARAVEAVRYEIKRGSKDDLNWHFPDETITKMRESLLISFYKIKLRLNDVDQSHIELLQALNTMIEVQQNYLLTL